MKKAKKINKTKFLRKQRVRKKIKAISQISQRPRVIVYKSNQYTYAQFVDLNGKTLFTVSSQMFEKEKKNKTELAKKVGEVLAEKILNLNIKEIVFDRGPYKYHGRIKAIAEGLREKGLNF
ncbi:MAG: 50S ribosomal protein L18 [Minisyncoccia bacterium]